MSNSDVIRLTSFSKGAGCGCKLSSADLHEILKDKKTSIDTFPTLLVGNQGNDDAAVMDIGNNQLLISTLDFFTPIVDDPFTFGRIAATNALSDVYAMGGSPSLALAILGWPIGKIPLSAAGEIIKGAQSVCDLAGIPLAGGHSIEAPEPFFGLQVNGITSKERLKKNSNVHLGDVLLLSKPLGTGIITTAAKKEKAEASHLNEAIASMTKLNDLGIALSKLQSVHAMTDITGFGLLGHLLEMIGDTEVSVALSDEQIPTFSFLKSYLDQFIYPDMTTKNFSAVTSKVTTLDARQLFTYCDPQTSGGLLVSVAPEAVDEVLQLFRENNVHSSCLTVIGNVISKEEKSVIIL